MITITLDGEGREEDLNDFAVWDAEQRIEGMELSGPGEDLQLSLPRASWWSRVPVPAVELLHLEMFLRMRGAGSPDRSGFHSLRQTPQPTGMEQFGSLIGNPQARVLLLGDRHNPNNEVSYRAAFGPWAGSGVWLMESLLTLDSVTLPTLALANAMEGDIVRMVESLCPTSIVALGRSAQHACREHDLEVGVVPHPQFARRFLNNKRAEYAQLILQVAQSQEDQGSWKG